MKFKRELCYLLIVVCVVMLSVIIVEDVKKTNGKNNIVQENMDNIENGNDEMEAETTKNDKEGNWNLETPGYEYEQTIIIHTEGTVNLIEGNTNEEVGSQIYNNEDINESRWIIQTYQYNPKK